MIITRTPFRVSFAGGGSDLRDYYNQRPYGAVVSAAIQSYMYIIIHPYFHDKIRIKYSKTEDAESVEEIKHPIVREVLRKVAVDKGIEIASFADVPAGTGLGSSSSFTVGLLHALYAYKGEKVDKEKLAQEACDIEIEILKEPIGKQDQYAAAFGGLNYIRFNQDESVKIAPISLEQGGLAKLSEKLKLYYVGGNRSASNILSQQKSNLKDKNKLAQLDKMVSLADDLRGSFHEWKVEHLAKNLHKGWQYKQELATGIGNKHVEELMEKAVQLGAKGGKLLGAGGTGFLLIYADNHEEITAKLGCRSLPFSIDKDGSKVISSLR
ncbi:MAG: GHMP kinase [Magnetococcales bacterium]|nr:GHMP kinase [Magnetococcales bacterium]